MTDLFSTISVSAFDPGVKRVGRKRVGLQSGGKQTRRGDPAEQSIRSFLNDLIAQFLTEPAAEQY